MTCTHECNQGDACTCADPKTSQGLWIRIPDLLIVGTVVLTIGIVIGVQLVKAGMTV